MRTHRLFLIALALLLALHCPIVRAEEPPPVPIPQPVKTGKERLGDKASDEQRVDNCKVPVERRGQKPRPHECGHEPKPKLTN